MARSSRGEDARFSFWKQGFDSPTGYEVSNKGIVNHVFTMPFLFTVNLSVNKRLYCNWRKITSNFITAACISRL